MLDFIINELEYSAFNLCEKRDSDVHPGFIEGTCPEATLLCAIRKLKKLAAEKETKPSMTLERAKMISSLCVDHGLFSMGLKDHQPASINDYSLEELLTANKISSENNGTKNEDGTTTYQIYLDPRAIAALYTAFHYEGEQLPSKSLTPLAIGPDGNTVLVVKVKKS